MLGAKKSVQYRGLPCICKSPCRRRGGHLEAHSFPYGSTLSYSLCMIYEETYKSYVSLLVQLCFYFSSAAMRSSSVQPVQRGQMKRLLWTAHPSSCTRVRAIAFADARSLKKHRSHMSFLFLYLYVVGGSKQRPPRYRT